MNKPLYLVCAKSFTGKDYIVDKMCKDFNMSKVVSKTTRKQRYAGENTHVFVTKEQALKELPNSLADTYFDDNYYYTDLESVNNKDFYIIDTKIKENNNPLILIKKETGKRPEISDIVKDVPNFRYSEHSGNTLSASWLMFVTYKNKPEMVKFLHGSLAPLVGDSGYYDNREDVKKYIEEHGI